MPRVTPKQNWTGSNAPLAPDFNRIEGNSQQAFDEIDAEEARATAAENAEAASRLAYDIGYTGSSGLITDYPVGSFLIGVYGSGIVANTTVYLTIAGSGVFPILTTGPGDLIGTWKTRGSFSTSGGAGILCQRIA